MLAQLFVIKYFYFMNGFNDFAADLYRVELMLFLKRQ